MPSPRTGRATANAVGVAACAGRGRGVPFGDAHERRPTSRDGSPFVTVREDAALAASSGIASTPSFVIGRVVNGEFEDGVKAAPRLSENCVQRLDLLGRAGVAVE